MSAETTDDLVRSAGQRLIKAGIPNGLQEARWLLAHTGADQIEAFHALLARRLNREPLQHILGSTPFYKLELKTDHRALIPREDSYEVVALAQQCLDRLGKADLKLADLGTGSGALLAALLTAYPNTTGIAVERSDEAMSLATENFAALGLSDRIDCFTGSWADWADWSACDLIISNPPYIRSDVIPTLEPEVREHDPLEALDGGTDGLDAYRQIISLGAQKMRPDAYLVLEIGHDQRRAVTTLLEDADFMEIQHQKDLSGHDRGIAARRPPQKGLGEIDSSR